MKHKKIHLLGKKFLTNAILVVGLGSIALLAIPACLFLGLIGIIWSTQETNYALSAVGVTALRV